MASSDRTASTAPLCQARQRVANPGPWSPLTPSLPGETLSPTGDMLSPDERRVLLRHWFDHPVATCPDCGEVILFDEIGRDIIFGQRDFCPACRADLARVLRDHLVNCTWLRVQNQEIRDRSRMIQDEARQKVKESQETRSRSDLLRREAEVARAKSRRTRGDPPDGVKS